LISTATAWRMRSLADAMESSPSMVTEKSITPAQLL
jgi:hypothetical protein